LVEALVGEAKVMAGQNGSLLLVELEDE